MSFLQGITHGGGLGGGNVVIGADTRGIRQQVRQGMQAVRQEMEAGARAGEATAKRTSAAWSAVGTAMKVGVLGVVAAVGAGVAAAVQFESAWAGVRKTLDATPAELAELRQQFRDLAKEIPVSVNELAQIGETAGAMGIAKEGVLEFTKTVALIGQTTNVTTDAAATSLGQLSNVLHLTEADYSRFAATLVDLGNKGASTEAQILEMASRAGSAAGLVGIGAKEVLAYSSAVASLGIEVEAGGTSLQSFFLKANAIVGAGSGIAEMAERAGMSVDKFMQVVMKGGAPVKALAESLGVTTKKLKELTLSAGQLDIMGRVAGMTGERFAKAFEKDAAGALQKFLEGLGRLRGAEQQGVLKDLKLGDIRMTRTLLGLANGADLLANNLDNAAEAWDANTAASDEAAKRFETTASQLALLKNLIQDYLITLGDMALPAVKALLVLLRDELPKAIAFLGRLWDRTLAPAVAQLGKAFGRLGEAVGKLFGGGQDVAGEVNTQATAFEGLANALAQVVKLLAAAVDSVAWLLDNPIGQWVARIVAAVAAVKLLTGGVSSLLGMLKGTSASMLRTVGLGRLVGPAGAGNTASDVAARALTGSAGDLSGSARALNAAAGKLAAGGGVAGALGAGGAVPAGYRPTGTKGAYVDPQGAIRGDEEAVAAEIALRARMKAAEDEARRAGQNMVRRAAGDLADGIKTGAGRAKELIKSGVNQVSNGIATVFWPVMIASVATEFMKAPIGDFISKNTQFKRAGAKIKEDFFGGLLALFEADRTGNDLFVDVPAIGIGNRTFDTKNLPGLNPTQEQLDALNRGGVGGALAQQQLAPEALKALRRGVDESVAEWYQRIRKQLEVNGLSTAEIDAAMEKYRTDTTFFDPAKAAANQAALEAVISKQLNTLMGGMTQSLKDGVSTSLSTALRGTGSTLTNTQIVNMPKKVYDALAALMVQNEIDAIDPGLLAISIGLVSKPSLTRVPGAPGTSRLGAGDADINSRTEQGAIADAQKVLDDTLKALTPSQEAERQLGLKALTYFENGIRKAGKSEKAQKAFLAQVNAMLIADGQQPITWDQLIDWKAQLADDTFVDAQRQLNKRMKLASVEAARTGAAGGAQQFWHWWGKEIMAADTAAEKEKLRKKLNDAIPDDMDKKEFAKWLKSVVASAKGTPHGTVISEWMTGTLPKNPTEADILRMRGWLAGTVSKGSTEAIDGKLADDLEGKGYDIMDHIADGIQSRESQQRLKSAIKTAVGSMLGSVPSSPVKEGPLKHPFLPNAGKKMMEQISAGMASNPLKLPPMPSISLSTSSARLAGAAAGQAAGGNQTLIVDKLQMYGKSDEQSILARTRFMAPSGRR